MLFILYPWDQAFATMDQQSSFDFRVERVNQDSTGELDPGQGSLCPGQKNLTQSGTIREHVFFVLVVICDTCR